MVRPEQSYVSGPAAPHTYGLPSWPSAQSAAWSPSADEAPELYAQLGACTDVAGPPSAAAVRDAAAAAAWAAAASAACLAASSAASCACASANLDAAVLAAA